MNSETSQLPVVEVTYPKELLPAGQACLCENYQNWRCEPAVDSPKESPEWLTHIVETYTFRDMAAAVHFQLETALALGKTPLRGEPKVCNVARKSYFHYDHGNGYYYDSICGFVGHGVNCPGEGTVYIEGKPLEGAAAEAFSKAGWLQWGNTLLDTSRSTGRDQGLDAGRLWMEQPQPPSAVAMICEAKPGALAEVLASLNIAAPAPPFDDAESNTMYEIGWRDGFRAAVVEASNSPSPMTNDQ